MLGTKNFYLNKKNFFWLKFFAGLIVISLFIFVLNFFNGGIRNAFFNLSAPIQKTFWGLGESSSSFLGSFLNGGSFFKENENLKSENQKLLAQISSLESIIGGNQAQSVVSLACQNEQFSLKMAGVIGMGKEDTLTINKGYADGIKENMPVISEQKALVGKILKVYKNYSEVSLISNKNSVINVKILQPQEPIALVLPTEDSATSTDTTSTDAIENIDILPAKTEIDGVIKGSGGSKVFLDLVPVDDVINTGDTLVTSALEGAFPKDLLVGKITSVNKNDQNPHQKAEVQPFFNISSDNLFVITNYKQN